VHLALLGLGVSLVQDPLVLLLIVPQLGRLGVERGVVVRLACSQPLVCCLETVAVKRTSGMLRLLVGSCVCPVDSVDCMSCHGAV